MHVVAGDEPEPVHQQLADTLDTVIARIREIQADARHEPSVGSELPRWPMIVLRTPKGWTGPKVVDGEPVEGTWRAHQVPLAGLATNPEHLAQLEAWMKSYRPEELFDEHGAVRAEITALAPDGDRRMGANPHANGGLLLRDLDLPDFRTYAVDVPAHGGPQVEATHVLGTWLRDVMAANTDRFRIMGPDETASNRLQAVFETTDRAWMAKRRPGDDHLAPDGRVMEVLSEHLCEGWLEGYLLTGRHGLFNSYEAFIHIVDSMFNQHAKWLKESRRDAVAPSDRVAELPAVESRVAPGPQRLLAPGSRLHRPRREQEGRDRARVLPARRELPALGGRPLPPEPRLRERGGGRQAAPAGVAHDGRGAPALRARDRHVGVGVDQRGRRGRRGARVRRRRPHARDARGRRDAARAPPVAPRDAW